MPKNRRVLLARGEGAPESVPDCHDVGPSGKTVRARKQPNGFTNHSTRGRPALTLPADRSDAGLVGGRSRLVGAAVRVQNGPAGCTFCSSPRNEGPRRGPLADSLAGNPRPPPNPAFVRPGTLDPAGKGHLPGMLPGSRPDKGRAGSHTIPRPNTPLLHANHSQTTAPLVGNTPFLGRPLATYRGLGPHRSGTWGWRSLGDWTMRQGPGPTGSPCTAS